MFYVDPSKVTEAKLLPNNVLSNNKEDNEYFSQKEDENELKKLSSNTVPARKESSKSNLI